MARTRPSIRSFRRQGLIAWGIIFLMVLLCGGLGLLQYRWTGELGRAEMIQLRSGRDERVQAFCREFDATVADACEGLLPSARDVEARGFATAHVERFLDWAATGPRPIFRRLAIATATNDTLRLLELNQKEGQLMPMAWPSEWEALRENLLSKARGPGPGRPGGPGGPDGFGGPGGGGSGGHREPGSRERPSFEREPFQESRGPGGPGGPGGPPRKGGGPGFAESDGIFFDGTGQLIEFPIFGRGGPRGIAEFMIFELDLAYATNSWLPEMVRRHFNATDKILHDITIKRVAPPQSSIFATGLESFSTPPETPVQLTFNPQLGIGRLREERKGDGRWLLEARHRPGELEKIVAASRLRNLSLAVLLNALMLVAGVALVRYTHRSRQLSERQMDFVANVSHELRTPLTVISGAGQNLARGLAHDPAAIHDYAQLILQHADQLKAMVEEILAFAGAKKRPAIAAYSQVLLGQILRDAVQAVAAEIEAARCEVALEIPPDLPALRGDPLALSRAFQNLIVNAAKHGAAGKWIGIHARVLEGRAPRVEVQVTDRGPGISREEEEEIFKPFVRGLQAREQAIRGSGLGLSVVREIVEAHGGTVGLQSTPGPGATFVVRLPAEPTAL